MKSSISSNYQEIIPAGEISRIVESYWEAYDSNHFVLFPDGTFNIIYSSDSFTINGKLMHPGVYFFPLNTEVLKIAYHQKITGIRLKAFVYNKILANKNIFETNSSSIWRIKNTSIFIGMQSKKIDLKSNELRENMSVLDQLVYDIAFQDLKIDENFRYKINYILEKKGVVNINEMAKEFSVKRQTLHKCFIKNLGISPKNLANIWRLNNFIDIANKGYSLTQSALEAGYFDQSHSIKEFKNYIKTSPRKILNDVQLKYIGYCIHNRFTNRYDPSF